MGKMLSATIVVTIVFSLLGCSKDEEKTTTITPTTVQPTPSTKAANAERSPTAIAPTVKEKPSSPVAQPQETTPGVATTTITHATAEKSNERLKADAKIAVLDIRTPKEFAEGHIDGAINIDFYADDFSTKLAALDTSKTYVIHCRSGGRSTKSLSTFQKLGFAHIIHMDGGMNAWQESGLPTTK